MSLRARKQPFNVAFLIHYKKYNNILKATLLRAKEIFFEKKFIQCGSNMRQVRKTVNEATDSVRKNKSIVSSIVFSDGRLLGLDQKREMADGFNEHFVTICEQISERIKGARVKKDLKIKYKTNKRFINSFFLAPVPLNEVLTQIGRLKKKFLLVMMVFLPSA